MSKKPIIVFEGIEGSGKSHHISMVSKYLNKKKISHIKIREPGGNPNSEKIRKLILNNKSNFNQNTDLLLYMASRSENIDIIKKSFNKKIILIDRFTDSTIAYQHFGMGVDINLIESLGVNDIFLNTFYLKDQIHNFINKKNFKPKITIIEDGKNILNTGGGIKNILNHTSEDNVLIFNPDTIWKKNYSREIIEMETINIFRKRIRKLIFFV